MAVAMTNHEEKIIAVFLSDAGELPVTNMFDRFSKETTDRNAAVKLVAKLPDGTWLCSTCEPDEIEYLQ